MSPVTRIFDVVKSASSSSDTETSTFVVLPQPIVHAKDVPRDDKMTFVGLGKGGHFALSELSYPYVTHGADKAGCYSKGIDWPYLDHNERLKSIVGIHSAQFVYPDSHPHPASLPARSQNEDERPVQSRSTSPPLPSSPSLGGSKLLGLAVSNPVDLSIVVLLFSLALYVLRGGSRKGKYKFPSEGREFQQSQSQQDAVKEIVIPGVGLEKPEEVIKPEPIVEVEQPRQPETKEPNPTPPLVEETTIIAEARVPEDEPTIVADDAKSREVRFDPKPQEIKDEEETVAPAPPVTPKKKKAHRGQRGGARRRKGNSNSEKEEDRIDKIVNDAKKVEQEITLQPDMTDGSSMNEVETSKVVINGLEVYEDEILGRFIMLERSTWENLLIKFKGGGAKEQPSVEGNLKTETLQSRGC
jgi:serine/threonine-protein kinase/endoribonuclease IRE1